MADETRTDRSPRAAGRHVLLSGGGSGGHVFPALAVGDELARRGWRVSFGGDPAGMERRLVESRGGVEFVPLPARPFVGRSALSRLAAARALASSARAARRYVRANGVDAVVGTGGYASAAAVLGAAWARRPALLVEPNARPGAANRWLSRFAAAAATAYESSGRELRCASFVAGVPIRAEFFAVPPLDALDPALPPRLLVLGGSQGARRLNRALPLAAALAIERLPGLEIVHQCGARNVDETEALWRQHYPRLDGVEIVPFVDDVAGAMGRAALVVSRAGAITLAEIAAAGRGSLLVPLELAGGHQEANARQLAERGAASLVADAAATPERLADEIVRLLSDRAALAAMGRAARELARPGAAAAIADRVESLAGGRR